jgi:hypothetical protein
MLTCFEDTAPSFRVMAVRKLNRKELRTQQHAIHNCFLLLMLKHHVML